MHEPDQPDRVFDPPRPVWVRQPAVGRQREDVGVPGLLLAWTRVYEWGVWGWRARVATDDSGSTRLVPTSSVLPRDL